MTELVRTTLRTLGERLTESGKNVVLCACLRVCYNLLEESSFVNQKTNKEERDQRDKLA